MIKIRNHICMGILHGGYEDAASLTLWLDEAEGIAHLTGHSGEDIPLDGPVAPQGAITFTANGKPGEVATFEREDVEKLKNDLQESLTKWKPGGDNAQIQEDIQIILEDFDLCEFTYAEWLDEYDPETYKEVYG